MLNLPGVSCALSPWCELRAFGGLVEVAKVNVREVNTSNWCRKYVQEVDGSDVVGSWLEGEREGGGTEWSEVK
jgi:hypothetical protein